YGGAEENLTQRRKDAKVKQRRDFTEDHKRHRGIRLSLKIPRCPCPICVNLRLFCLPFAPLRLCVRFFVFFVPFCGYSGFTSHQSPITSHLCGRAEKGSGSFLLRFTFHRFSTTGVASI